LKNKLSWVFLIFLVLILGSCSLAREEKYSYYIEKKEEYYHNPETNLSEDVLIFTTNISVKLDENIVLKMRYGLTEKDYSLFDINEVLDSINAGEETAIE
jgi:hypothetical protein